MYIHELPTWPKFIWSEETLSKLLVDLHLDQGRLIGKMESIGLMEQQESILENLTKDVVKTSEIEGEMLNPATVRSSIARHLGIEYAALQKSDRNVEGIVEVLLDATKNYQQPLTEKRLFHWHSLLFEKSRFNVGKWRRDSVQVISGETVHFEGPPAEKVKGEMTRFLDFFNKENKIDPLLKSALMHLWFVTIHPFDDGNGRIGRAIADMLLARSERSSSRFYSLSAQIQAERKNYYAVLEKTQKGDLDITSWMEWYLHTLRRAIDNAEETFQKVRHKSKVWEALRKAHLNERQKKMIDCLLSDFEGKLTSSKWAKMAKCSQDSAHRDIQDLIHQGVLMKDPAGGRSTSYSLNPSWLS